MNEEKLDELFKLGTLMELLSKCKELVQLNCLLGGHRSYSDDMLSDMIQEVYNEIRSIKENILVKSD